MEGIGWYILSLVFFFFPLFLFTFVYFYFFLVWVEVIYIFYIYLLGIVRSATDSKVMIQLQSSLEKISVTRDMIREEHFEPTRSVDNYNDYSHIPYGAQTPSGGATPFRPQTPSHYGMNNERL